MKRKRQQISNILNLLLILMAFAFTLYRIFLEGAIPTQHQTLIPLYQILGETASKIASIPIAAISLLIWLQIIKRYKFVQKGTLNLLAFVLLLVTLNPWFLVNVENVLALLFLSIMAHYLLIIYKQKTILSPLFTSAFLLGLATSLFYPALLFLPLLYIAIAILRPFELRNQFIILLGFLFPFIYIYGIAYLFDLPIADFKIGFDAGIFPQGKSLSLILLYAALATVSLISILRVFSQQNKMIVHQRKQLQILFLFALFAFILVFFSASIKQTIIFIAFPLMAFFGFFMEHLQRSWVIQLLLLLLFMTYVWQHFFEAFPFL